MAKRPTLEKIEPVFGSSFTIREFSSSGEENQSCTNDYWHFHPEYEIVYVSNGVGKRHIGDHISYFEGGDLIFLGPNIPHFSFTEDLREAHQEIVVQMREDFLGSNFLSLPELSQVKRLFHRAQQGITFSGETKHRIGKRLHELVRKEPFERLMGLLAILQELAVSADYQLLNANGYTFEVNAQDRERMETVYGLVRDHFQRHITLEEVSGSINMTEPAFCRYFKRLTHRTFTQFVNEFRIAHACQLLNDESMSIAEICFESGFNNLSHFNKQFKQTTGNSPREYRKSLSKVVRL